MKDEMGEPVTAMRTAIWNYQLLGTQDEIVFILRSPSHRHRMTGGDFELLADFVAGKFKHVASKIKRGKIIKHGKKPPLAHLLDPKRLRNLTQKQPMWDAAHEVDRLRAEQGPDWLKAGMEEKRISQAAAKHGVTEDALRLQMRKPKKERYG
jgi:hypothetical protein